MFLDPRNGPAYDLPAPNGQVRTYVIASTPRTGSTLLCRLLWQTGLAGAPKEYLNPMQRRDWQLRRGRVIYRPLRGAAVGLLRLRPLRGERLSSHLDDIRRRRSSNGWFGLKIHHHHFQALGADVGPVDRWVYIRRQDRIAQAVSWERALQTGRWIAEQSRRIPPVYSRRRIQRRLDAVAQGETFWWTYFSHHQIKPLTVTYEAFIQDQSAIVRQVLQYLGIPDAIDDHPPVPTRRQADSRSKEWILRFQRGI